MCNDPRIINIKNISFSGNGINKKYNNLVNETVNNINFVPQNNKFNVNEIKSRLTSTTDHGKFQNLKDTEFDEDLNLNLLNEEQLNALKQEEAEIWELYLTEAFSHLQNIEEKVALKNEESEKIMSSRFDLAERSEKLFKIQELAYFPEGVTEFLDRTLNITLTFDKLSINNNKIKQIFTSHDSLTNGKDIFDPNNIGFDLENCTLARVDLLFARNETRMYVGINILSYVDTINDKDIVLGARKERSLGKNENYHFELPSRTTFQYPITIYKNNSNVNHEYAKLYPWLTPNAESIDRDVIDYFSDKKLVPTWHPIMRIIAENVKRKKKWIFPEITKNPDFADYYEVTNNLYYSARRMLSKIIRISFPITNLNTLGLSVEPVKIESGDDPDPFSITKTGQDIYLKLKLYYTPRIITE